MDMGKISLVLCRVVGKSIFVCVLAILSVGASGLFAQSGELGKGLVGYWKLNEGQGRKASNTAAKTRNVISGQEKWIDGPGGKKALYLNGKSTYSYRSAGLKCSGDASVG